ncbi:MAG TPA: hypothetical protein VLG37_04450 [Candidatus Saccharimonadales bacterium]|nr:hypothetical protein [Candidatus Saccharimonadales bacterium]
MSAPETFSPIPKEIAREVAESELAFRNLQLEAKELGNTVLAAEHAATANEVSSLYLERRAKNHQTSSEANPKDRQVPAETEPVAAEAKVYDAETIDELLNSTYFATKHYLGRGGEGTTTVSKGEKATRAGLDASYEPVRDGVADLIIHRKGYEEQEAKDYAAAGVSEVVTLLEPATEVVKLSDMYDYRTVKSTLKSLSRQRLEDESIKVVLYKIVTEKPYEYRDPHGRGGAQSEFSIALPATKADELYQAMVKDPELARKIYEAMILKALSKRMYEAQPVLPAGYSLEGDTPEEVWAGRRPPYDEWKATNGGVNRMAFRSSVLVAPGNSMIVEY